MLTGYCVSIAFCLSQLSHSPEEMRRWRSSGEVYCNIIPVMKARPTEGMCFFAILTEHSVLITIWPTELDLTSNWIVNNLLYLSVCETIDPQEDVTCLCHLLRRASLTMFDRWKTWKESSKLVHVPGNEKRT